MTAYVVGLLLDESGRVLLIEKKRGPAAVVGKWNGPGGKIEQGETYAQAVAREVAEETGVATSPDDWRRLVALHTDGGTVTFLTARTTAAQLDAAYTREDEEVLAHPWWDAVDWNVVPNLTWLLPLAAYDHDYYAPITVTEVPRPDRPIRSTVRMTFDPDRITPEAAASLVGQTPRITAGFDHRRPLGRGTVVAAEAADDGASLLLTIEHNGPADLFPPVPVSLGGGPPCAGFGYQVHDAEFSRTRRIKDMRLHELVPEPPSVEPTR